ncbi:MAG: hypothetical protein HYR91_02760 [Flavobacteriia bacterium]|nr:hypothetical protein [Flavobacteriia bacterium]
MPWINFTDYTKAQLLWNGVGCFFWFITYVVLVRNSFKLKFVEMPFFIASGNIAWEFVWSFCFTPSTGKFYAVSYQVCFWIDVLIFSMVFIYGAKQIDIPFFKKKKKKILVGITLIWLPLNYFFVKQGFDTSIGANSGYILNLIISLLYPIAYFRNNASNYSLIIAWCKFLGTGCITVSMFLIYPSNYFVQTLGIACFILDLSFAIVLVKKLK